MPLGPRSLSSANAGAAAPTVAAGKVGLGARQVPTVQSAQLPKGSTGDRLQPPSANVQADSENTTVVLPSNKPRKKMGLGLGAKLGMAARRVEQSVEEEEWPEQPPKATVHVKAPAATPKPIVASGAAAPSAAPPAPKAKPVAGTAPPASPAVTPATPAAPATPVAPAAALTVAQRWTRRLAEESRACAGLSKEQRLEKLGPLYHQATQEVLLRPTDERGGARLWVEYAQLQAETSMDDARDVFKHMKRERIGIDDATVAIAWAQLEVSHGNVDKARQILEKASKERGARIDQSAIAAAIAELSAGSAGSAVGGGAANGGDGSCGAPASFETADTVVIEADASIRPPAAAPAQAAPAPAAPALPVTPTAQLLASTAAAEVVAAEPAEVGEMDDTVRQPELQCTHLMTIEEGSHEGSENR